MRASVFVALLSSGLVPAVAQANDISDALHFAETVMGDNVFAGLEEYEDNDPNEALSLLLAKNVVPGRAPESYLEQDDDGLGLHPSSDTLETLGDSRLNYVTLKPFIDEASAETGLPGELIDAVIRTESGYRPKAVSRKGAIGLMQLMPATARQVGVHDPFDPRQNILGGSRYLRSLVDQFGNLKHAVAAYNAGPGAVAKHNGVPPFSETRRYVDTVLGRYKIALEQSNGGTRVAAARAIPAAPDAQSESAQPSIVSSMMRAH